MEICIPQNDRWITIEAGDTEESFIEKLDSAYPVGMEFEFEELCGGCRSGYRTINPLTSLHLYRISKITDDGIRHLTQLTNLNLHNNLKIPDDGFRHLTQLTSLNLSNNFNITDDGLRNLRIMHIMMV